VGPSGRIGALLDRVCAIVELAVLARVGIHVVCEGEARFDDQEDEGVVVDGEAPQPSSPAAPAKAARGTRTTLLSRRPTPVCGKGGDAAFKAAHPCLAQLNFSIRLIFG